LRPVFIIITHTYFSNKIFDFFNIIFLHRMSHLIALRLIGHPTCASIADLEGNLPDNTRVCGSKCFDKVRVVEDDYCAYID